jgi:hypothetical protein
VGHRVVDVRVAGARALAQRPARERRDLAPVARAGEVLVAADVQLAGDHELGGLAQAEVARGPGERHAGFDLELSPVRDRVGRAGDRALAPDARPAAPALAPTRPGELADRDGTGPVQRAGRLCEHLGRQLAVERREAALDPEVADPGRAGHVQRPAVEDQLRVGEDAGDAAAVVHPDRDARSGAGDVGRSRDSVSGPVGGVVPAVGAGSAVPAGRAPVAGRRSRGEDERHDDRRQDRERRRRHRPPAPGEGWARAGVAGRHSQVGLGNAQSLTGRASPAPSTGRVIAPPRGGPPDPPLPR